MVGYLSTSNVVNVGYLDRQHAEVYFHEVYILDITGRTHTIAQQPESRGELYEQGKELAELLGVEFHSS